MTAAEVCIYVERSTLSGRTEEDTKEPSLKQEKRDHGWVKQNSLSSTPGLDENRRRMRGEIQLDLVSNTSFFFPTFVAGWPLTDLANQQLQNGLLLWELPFNKDNHHGIGADSPGSPQQRAT
ncbi:unnamed protein product [Clonostachys rosea f. rosea IK726]|uniref:Uncharacterized protein n=1 Tax=Clonostachys rosea f. rosea IK726 TaxID=1349383 RepID=A0ACA9TRJ1_BIOOC|nr:unnamed protein product [Clonostachys rosea f. rosea IK726]